MRRTNKAIKGKYYYNVLNMCKHPCVCADMYAGLSNHTIWQWGHGSNKFAAPDTVRPKPPATVEEMVGMSSKHLMEELLGHKPREGKYKAQRRYDKLSLFYVVANRL